MAKVKLDYMSLSLRAEGSDDVVRELSGRFLDMAEKYGAPGVYFNVPPVPDSIFADGCRDPEEVEPLTEPKEVAPGADWDVVAIYDDAGIPSIMHRFRRVSNKELFGGSDKPHPAFIIGGEVYDEIYISVYPNAMIHGKPYSLPYADPATGFTADEFAKACFSKGEGWHPLTAAEWGLLANLSYANGTKITMDRMRMVMPIRKLCRNRPNSGPTSMLIILLSSIDKPISLTLVLPLMMPLEFATTCCVTSNTAMMMSNVFEIIQTETAVLNIHFRINAGSNCAMLLCSVII